jgi:hypothetical protein
MKKYIVRIHETRSYEVEVKAKNQELAINKVWSGEVDFSDKDLVLSEVESVFIR